MKMIQLKNMLVEQSSLLKTFPIGSKNFNVGYDASSMGNDTNLDRDTVIHNSDYGGGDAAHRSRGGHKGIDIFAPSGEPVVACVTGTVINVSKKDKGAGGLTVTIEKNGISYYYAHMSNVYVDRDQSVESGQLIGTCGNTGNASGTHPHVHFSIYKTKLGYNNGSIDPWPSLKDVLYTVTKSDKNIEELHLKLKKLGFNLGNEAENGTNGPKTQEALKKLAKKYQNAKNNGNWSTSTMSFISNIFKSKIVKSIFGGKNDEMAPENNQTTNTAGDVSMMPNRIILFFKNKGLTTSQAAGIAGNIAVESQFNPSAVGDNGTSFGLAQWHGDNGDRLKQWTTKNGYKWNSIDGQLNFLWYQLQHTQSAALIALRNQKTPRDAAYVFAEKFERPASISNNRIENAEKFYNEYTKNATKTI